MELQNIEDIKNLEIKSLTQVINESSKPWCYDEWKEIEKQLIENKKAPSLSSWLLYEHQFKKKTVLDISKGLCKGTGSVTNMFEKMMIPKRNITETVALRAYKKPPKEELERLYHENELSINEIAEIKGVDTSTVQNWFRKYKIKKRVVGTYDSDNRLITMDPSFMSGNVGDLFLYQLGSIEAHKKFIENCVSKGILKQGKINERPYKDKNIKPIKI